MDKKTIDKIVWWIPIRKFRDYVRCKLLSRLPIIKQNLKYKHIEKLIEIFSDSELDLEKKNLVKYILYSNSDEYTSKILHDYFINNEDRAIHKHLRYFDLYDRYFKKFRGKDVNILEIGVQNGGSTKMWKHYFSYLFPNAKVQIYGIDIDPRCKDVEEDGIKIFIGSQTDRDFWKKIKSEIPKLDIVIDDGGHTMEQQIVTLEEIYEHIKDDGVYWCEDVGTSYWPLSHGGGYRNANSYIEYTKNIIDYLNAYYSLEEDDLEVNKYTNTAYSICYHENVVVIEKKIRSEIYNKYPQAVIGKNIR